MKLSKRIKIMITSMVNVLLVTFALLIVFNIRYTYNNEGEVQEKQEESLKVVRVQGEDASLNGVAKALDGEITEKLPEKEMNIESNVLTEEVENVEEEVTKPSNSTTNNSSRDTINETKPKEEPSEVLTPEQPKEEPSEVPTLEELEEEPSEVSTLEELKEEPSEISTLEELKEEPSEISTLEELKYIKIEKKMIANIAAGAYLMELTNEGNQSASSVTVEIIIQDINRNPIQTYIHTINKIIEPGQTVSDIFRAEYVESMWIDWEIVNFQ